MTRVLGTMAQTVTNQVREDAERWFVRLMAVDCTPTERETFKRWHDADPANAAAYAATERLWAKLEGLEHDEEVGSYATAALVPEPPARRWHIPAAAAASVLIAVGAFYYVRPLSNPSVVVSGSGIYQTSAQQRTFTLTDGSTIRLDIDTDLTVQLNEDVRNIRLSRGRAIFEVKHDPARPFQVDAGSGRVTAIGTRFQVDRAGDNVKIVLTEGAVVVQQSAESIRMAPGEEVRYSTVKNGAWTKRAIDPEPPTSWALGYHVFRATPLNDALDEINRYAERKIYLADPTLGELPVSGSFKTGDSVSIATALPTVLPIRIDYGGDEIKLSRR